MSGSHSRFALLETFSNEFSGQYRDPRTSENRVILSRLQSASFQLPDTVLAVSDLRQRAIAIDQSDRNPFGHISHVVTSVCYLLGTILNIKYKFWENLSSRFDLRAVVAIVIFNIHVSCGISPICQGFQNMVCACLTANESSRLGWLLIAHCFL